MIADNLAAALRDVLVRPRVVISAACWQLGAGTHYRIPDLMVLDTLPTENLVTETPRSWSKCFLIIVSTTSCARWSSTRAREWIQYWVVDPESRTLDASRNVDVLWRGGARLGEPTGANSACASEVDLPCRGGRDAAPGSG